MALTLRTTKGSALTQAELDANFSGLSDGSLWAAAVAAASTLTLTKASAGDVLVFGSGTASSKTGYLYVDTNTVTLATAAASNGTKIALDVTNSLVTLTAAGTEACRLATTHAYFPTAGTTASAANAFLNSGSSPVNELLRSTSSLRYKTDLQGLTLADAKRIALGRNGISYLSTSVSDDPATRWIGYVAEEVAAVDSRFVTHDADGKPSWVQYERFIVPHGLILDDHERRLAALEAKVFA